MKAKKALAAAMSAVTIAGSLAYSPAARADDVSPSGKGIVGGALLGGEVVSITLSLVGVRNGYAYLGGDLGGAIAGGILGYVVEQGSSDGRAPVYMLAGGLALIIPAVVLTLNATAYQGAENATEDKAPTNTPAADPGQAGGSAVVGTPASSGAAPTTTTPGATPPPASPSTAPAPAPNGGGGGSTPPTQGPVRAPVSQTPVHRAPSAPSSMIDVNSLREGVGVRIGVPAPEVRNVFSTQERVKLGANQASEVHFKVLNVTF